MGKTWTAISSEMDVLLDDSGRTSYPDTLRIAAYNRAVEFFATTHTAIPQTATATTTTYLEGVFATYPSDMLEMPDGGIQPLDTLGIPTGWMEPRIVAPGYTVMRDGYMPFSDGVYILDPTVTLIRFWYYSNYAVITGDASTSTVPLWADWGVTALATAYMLIPSMMNQQLLRQFQPRSDAGQPTDNPPRVQAVFMLKVYESVVATRGRQNRSLIYTAGSRL